MNKRFFIYLLAYTIFISLFCNVALKIYDIKFFWLFMAVIILRFNKQHSLQAATLCGITFDLFFASDKFGINILIFAIVTEIVYRLKFLLFDDSIFTIPITAIILNIISTCIYTSLTYYPKNGYDFTFSWLYTEIFSQNLKLLAFSFMLYLPILKLIPFRSKFTPQVVRFNKCRL